MPAARAPRAIPALRMCQGMIEQGRAAQAEEHLVRLIRVGQNVRKKERDMRKVGVCGSMVSWMAF